MRRYIKFQPDRPARFCAILEKLMGVASPPPPVPARVKTSCEKIAICENVGNHVGIFADNF